MNHLTRVERENANAAIARWLGMTEILRHETTGKLEGWLDGCWKQVADYCGDLNAMHGAEAKLTDEQHSLFRSRLFSYAYREPGCTSDQAERNKVSATAEQRAMALLRVIGVTDL